MVTFQDLLLGWEYWRELAHTNSHNRFYHARSEWYHDQMLNYDMKSGAISE